MRDLVRSLQDTEDPLKLEIGLSAAEQVIRQKANAGTELGRLHMLQTNKTKRIAVLHIYHG